MFATMMRTHQIGKEVRLRHIRSNVEFPAITADRNIDPNYQEFRRLPQAVRVQPGDRLISECIYDSSTRDQITLGKPACMRCSAHTFAASDRAAKICASAKQIISNSQNRFVFSHNLCVCVPISAPALKLQPDVSDSCLRPSEYRPKRTAPVLPDTLRINSQSIEYFANGYFFSSLVFVPSI